MRRTRIMTTKRRRRKTRTRTTRIHQWFFISQKFSWFLNNLFKICQKLDFLVKVFGFPCDFFGLLLCFLRISGWLPSEKWLQQQSQWTKTVLTSANDSLTCALIDLGAFSPMKGSSSKCKIDSPIFFQPQHAILDCDSRSQAGSTSYMYIWGLIPYNKLRSRCFEREILITVSASQWLPALPPPASPPCWSHSPLPCFLPKTPHLLPFPG